MPSLTELVEKIRAGESVEPAALDPYIASANPVERFLANQARASLVLTQGQNHLLEALRAIDFNDQRILQQYFGIARFNGRPEHNASALYRFGCNTLTRGEWTPGLDAIQQALRIDAQQNPSSASAGLLADRDVCSTVAAQYDRAAQVLGRKVNPGPRKSQNTLSVAILVSGIVDETAGSELILALARQADAGKIELRVYCTDAAIRAGKFNPAQVPAAAPSSEAGRATIESLRGRRMDVWLPPADSDAVTIARMLTERVVRDGVHVLLVDAPLHDAAAWITVASKPIPHQIGLTRRGPIGVAGVEGVVFLDPARTSVDESFWKSRGVPSRTVPQGIECDAPTARRTRREFGVGESATVLMTCSSKIDQAFKSAFLDAMIQLLQQNPKLVYLIVGESQSNQTRKAFDQAGLGGRVGFAGRRRDSRDVLQLADIYLAEFPTADRDGVLQAMAASKPVVCLAGEGEASDVSRLVGGACPPATSASQYVEVVRRYVADPAARTQAGDKLREQIDANQSLSNTAGRLVECCYLISQPTRAAVVQQPIAAVA